jgi:hypothetical protein
MFKTRYRIVTDRYLGYEVQSRIWWFPFWIQCKDDRYYCTNTHPTIEKAKEFIERRIIKSNIIMEYNPHLDENPQLSLYSKIEYLIIMWSNDGTKTAGTLTRQIMELLKNK